MLAEPEQTAVCRVGGTMQSPQPSLRDLTARELRAKAAEYREAVTANASHPKTRDSYEKLARRLDESMNWLMLARPRRSARPLTIVHSAKIDGG
jgi:hypothetical protein